MRLFLNLDQKPDQKPDQNLFWEIGKRFALALWLIGILSFVFPPIVHADTGPKRSIMITVRNMPDEPYYFAILREGMAYHSPDAGHEMVDEGDQWIADLFYDYDEDGYCLFMYGGGASSIRYSGNINEYGTIGYSYMVPRTFKVMIVTRSGKVTVSEPLTVKAFNSVCVYDYADNSLVEGTAALSWPFFIESAFCLFVTLFVEGLILLFFGLFRGKNLLHFLVVNLITQTLLFGFNLLSVWFLSIYEHYILYWFLVEGVITLLEVFWYRSRLVNKRGEVQRTRNVWYGIVANLVSMSIDLPIVIFMVVMR